MRRSPHLLFALALALAPSICLSAEGDRPVGGVLTLSGKSYKLLHSVAYEMKFNDETVTAVLASDRPIDVAAIKKVLAENDGQDNELSFRQPHVRVVFNKSGEVAFFNAYAAGFTTNGNDDGLKGELKLKEGHVRGKASLPSAGEDQLQRSFDFQFAVGLLNTSAEQPQQAAPLAKLGVTGVFKGNGRPAKLAYVSAARREPFSDKPSLVLVFTEKDHSKDKRPDFNAAFGKYGSALIISCHEDGAIFGCEVAHAAHAQKPFSSSGSIESMEFQIAGGQVQGKVTTGGEQNTFKQTWDVDLTFAAPFVGTTKTAASKTSTAKPTTRPTTTARAPQPASPNAEEAPARPAVAALKATDLPFPQDAVELEYKAIVEHITFKHKSDVRTLAADMTKKLAAQGWTKDGADLLAPTAAILKRSRGDASLTVIVKPAGAGSQVTVFTEGLAWED